jgi:hypothetical protein
MPLLETRHIKATRKDRTCEDCERQLPKGSPAVAMFGMAHTGEKPYWAYTHGRGLCPRPSAFTLKEIERAAPGGREGDHPHKFQPKGDPMKPILTLAALLLAGCLTEPKTRVISCGTLDWEAPADTFAVSGGGCDRVE